MHTTIDLCVLDSEYEAGIRLHIHQRYLDINAESYLNLCKLAHCNWSSLLFPVQLKMKCWRKKWINVAWACTHHKNTSQQLSNYATDSLRGLYVNNTQQSCCHFSAFQFIKTDPKPNLVFWWSVRRTGPLPYVLVGHLGVGLDGGTLDLVLLPACSLAGAVAILSKLAGAASLQLLLPTETAVTHICCHTATTT